MDFSVIWDNLPDFADGLWVTVQLTWRFQLRLGALTR